MSQPPQNIDSQQSIDGSSLSKSQVAQAGRDIHQTYQEIHHYHGGDGLGLQASQTVREGVEKILLQQVKSEIDSRLATSLHSATFINLDKEKQTSQVERSWEADVKIGQQESIPLEKNAKIIEVFDQTNISGKLLILGAPGSGKTTTLLELAEELVKRAERQKTNPIPVLLNLSSWKPNKSLGQWLITELKSKYGVRHKITEGFLERYQLLPLLDGLDEVDTQWHEDCINAINQFYEQYRPENIVVCCRRQDYEATQIKLQLNGAVHLNALNEEQIQAYLLSVEHPEIWNSLETDDTLMEMAQSPLLLSVLTLARQAISFKQWSGLESSEEKRNYLISAYVSRMLTRPISHTLYAPGKEPTAQDTIQWLSVLARKLKAESQSEFLIEHIHISWLETTKQKLLYRLVTGTILGLVLGILLGLWWEVYRGLVAYIGEGLILSLVAGVFFGGITAMTYGFLLGSLGLLGFGLSDRTIKLFLYFPVMGALVGAIAEVLLESGTFYDGLLGGVLLGLFFACFLLFSKQEKVRLFETLRWSFPKAKSASNYGLLASIPLVFLSSLTDGIKLSFPRLALFLLLGIFLGGLIGGSQDYLKSKRNSKFFFLLAEKGTILSLALGLFLAFLFNLYLVVLVALNPGYVKQFFLPDNANLFTSVAVEIIRYEVMGGIIGLLLGRLVEMIMKRILGLETPLEELSTQRWSWKRSIKGILIGGVCSLATGILIFNMTLGANVLVRVWQLLILLLVWGSINTSIGFLVGGLRGSDIEIRKFPNQGIRRSAINSIVISLLISITLSLMFVGLGWLGGSLIQGANVGIYLGPLTGIVFGIALGGVCLNHVSIRFVLYKSGLGPWNYRKFLNYTSERMLMRQIGGRYQFIHGVVQDYFINRW